MHSGLAIFLWLAGVAGVQFLPPLSLAVAVALCGAAGLWLAPVRSVRLVRRIRFLLLAILVFFAGFTPGEALLADLPRLSPSREGVLLALEHVGRLLAVVLCVAVLLERLSAQRIVSGLYALFAPFEGAGLPAARLAVRLMLVLRYVEAGAPGGWRHWLEIPVRCDDEAIEVLEEDFGMREWLALLAIGVVMVGVWVAVS